MKQLIKNILFLLLDVFSRKNKVSILMYHSVSCNGKFFTVTPENFERQIEYIKNKNLKVVKLSDLVQKISSGEDVKDYVSITFDDGYKDNFSNAFEVLKKHNIPASIFVATDYVNKGFKNSQYLSIPMLSEIEMITMSSSGLIEFLPHTKSHTTVDDISEENLKNEIEGSRLYLEEILKIPVSKIFAYPKGVIDMKSKSYMTKNGWLAAVGVTSGGIDTNTDIYALNRNSVDSMTNMIQFRGILNSTVDMYEMLKKGMSGTSLVRQILKGKTIYRSYFNQLVEKHTKHLKGEILDLAGGERPSYRDYLSKDIKLVQTNISDSNNVSGVDFNGPLPFEDNSFDGVFLFNALYISDNPKDLLSEINRVLRPGGTCLIASPFISNEMPEPHDYARFTKEGLDMLFKDFDFSGVNIERFGERFTVTAYLLHPFFLFNIIRLPVYLLAHLLDSVIPTKITEKHPTPLGYFCVLRK
ncbi:MAG: peptidoglycan/xylan/chitin deacetylase (PgdA/CDA1 family) [Candidatus Paceibacteria bacterium]|jgi:peptidoglycan/xylan/chitin deacetylase (PgdA/CDA1 family)